MFLHNKKETMDNRHISLYFYAVVAIVLFLCCVHGKPFENSPPRYFYIYDWPEYMSDVWPPDKAPLHDESPYKHDFRPNNGAGKCILPDIGTCLTLSYCSIILLVEVR